MRLRSDAVELQPVTINQRSGSAVRSITSVSARPPSGCCPRCISEESSV
jgi:hypothetical protein